MRGFGGEQRRGPIPRPCSRGHRCYFRFRRAAHYCVARPNQWRDGSGVSGCNEHHRVAGGAGLPATRKLCDELVRVWKALLLVYRELDVRLRVVDRKWHFHHLMSDGELNDALHSFAGFPKLVSELTNGRAGIEYEIER